MDNKFKTMFDISMFYEKGKLINGYSNDKDDSGGETVFGLTRKNFPNLRIWASLDEQKGIVKKRGYKPTDEEYDEIMRTYEREFYMRLNIQYFQDEALAMQLFDFAINAGRSRAVKTLQRMMHINVDGICGMQTIATANVRHHKSVREDYRKNRIAFYQDIARKRNNQKFLKGWLKRANECDKDFLVKN